MSIANTSAQDRPLPTQGRRWIPRLALALALGFGLYGISDRISEEGAKASVSRSRLRLAQVTKGTFTREISAQGSIVTGNSRALYAFATGIVEPKVVAGDSVKKGALLAVIDSPALKSRLVQERALRSSLEAQAASALLDTQMKESQALTARNKAKIDIAAAQRDLRAFQDSGQSGAFAGRDIALAKDALARAEVALETADREIALHQKRRRIDKRSRKSQLDKQQAVLDELERQIGALNVVAPFDGRVGQLPISPGSRVEAGALVLTLVDLSDFAVEIKVPESYAKELRVGMQAQVRHQQHEQAAVVSSVSPEVVDQMVAARLRFVGEQPRDLRRHQRVSARIVIDSREDVLQIERGPFVEYGQGRHAWVLEGETVKKVSISLGIRSMGAIEVLRGPKLGDTVVVSGTEHLSDHERVQLVP